MCGIGGIIGYKDLPEARNIVGRINDCMSHRGPDDQGLFVTDNIALGQRRLSIIDISSAGHQPMFSPDRKLALVFNGEIYNFKELRSELTEYPFTSGTDSEVILAAYLKWGEKCVEKFSGMFAFALWDDEKKELFISRDRLGIKPLYYFKGDGFIVFASEIRALLNSGVVPRKLNKEGLSDYFIYQTVFAPSTIIKDVIMLMPGHSMIIDESGNENTSEYWNTSKRVEGVSDLSYKETCNSVKTLLTEAVEKRMIADVPFGAFLSGGVDSSAIVALMSEVSDSSVKTFSIVFDEEELSESKYSDLVAKKYNTEHHRIKLRVSDFLQKLPDALMSMDHPSGDGPNSYVVSEATKHGGITMALSGLGGDELFGGYPIFKRAQNKALPLIENLPLFLRSQLGSILTTLRSGVTSEKLAEFLKSEKADIDNFLKVSRQVIPQSKADRLLRSSRPEFKNLNKIKLRSGYLLSYISEFEINNYMQNVLLRDTDQMSMAHALEVRVPFLDHKLVEFVLSVPDQHKPLQPGKKLLIDSMGSLLPEETWNRKKMGFTLPWNRWMKNELADFCAQHIKALAQYDFVYGEEVFKLWEQFRGGDPNIPWTRLWHLVVLSDWLQRNSVTE